MIVDAERGVLVALGCDDAPAHGSLRHDGAVVELSTRPRRTVPEAIVEAAMLRGDLARAVHDAHGAAAGAAGLHPWSEAPSPSGLAPLRPRPATEVAGILGRFDPLCGLRVQVSVPSHEEAVRAFDGLRLHVPLLLAVAANSPFWRGRYTGLASARTVLRGAALPRGFGSYAAYVEAVDALVRAGAVGDPESVEWDVRLRPADGALELTVMDAQTRVDEVAGLAALVQCLARVHAADGARRAVVIPEVLLHNRAAAAREGIRTADELAALVEECAPVARELGCSHELAGIRRNATDPGHARQRSITASAGLAGLVGSLVADFADAAATALAT